MKLTDKLEFDKGGRVYEKKKTEPKNHKNHRYIAANNSVLHCVYYDTYQKYVFRIHRYWRSLHRRNSSVLTMAVPPMP